MLLSVLGRTLGRHCQQLGSQAYMASGGGYSQGPLLTPAFPFPGQAPPWHRVLGWQGVGMRTQETQPLCSPPTAWPPGSPYAGQLPSISPTLAECHQVPLAACGSCQIGCGAKYRARVLRTLTSILPRYTLSFGTNQKWPDICGRDPPAQRGAQAQSRNLRVTCLPQPTWACVPSGEVLQGRSRCQRVKLGCLLSLSKVT